MKVVAFLEPPSGRSYRRDPARAPERSRPTLGVGARRRPVAGVGAEGATRWGWFGPRARFRLFGQPNRIPGPSRPVPGIDLRGHRHIPGHLLIITDACRHEDVACELRDQPVFCGLTGRNFTQKLQKPAGGKESKGGHARPWTPFRLELPFPPCRLSSVRGNQISYQFSYQLSVRQNRHEAARNRPNN